MTWRVRDSLMAHEGKTAAEPEGEMSSAPVRGPRRGASAPDPTAPAAKARARGAEGDAVPASAVPASAVPPSAASVDGASPATAADAVSPSSDSGGTDASAKPPRKKSGPGSRPNNVRRLRVERMMSKAELARRAGLSVLTIDRVEKGYGCRMDTKRKILRALDLSLGDRVRVFGEEE